jgi:hypothetical protein
MVPSAILPLHRSWSVDGRALQVNYSSASARSSWARRYICTHWA